MNINYDLSCYEGNKVLMKFFFKDFFIMYKLGVKIFYYYNICDGVLDIFVFDVKVSEFMLC